MIGKILGLIALWPVIAFADTAPANITDYCSSSVFIGIQLKNNPRYPALKCADVQSRFETAFKAVQEISPVELSGPMLVIYNYELSRGSTYSWVTSTMKVDLGDLSKIEQQIAVFYHEMGHKIYFEYFAKKLPEVTAQLEIMNNYTSYLALCATSSTPDASCENNKAEWNLINGVDSYSDDFNNFFYMTMPYNELFADLVASLASDEKNAIALALTPCTHSDPACEYRAFSKNTIDMFSGTNPYSRFSPIRRDIWETYVTPRLADKPALLNELAEVFVDDSIANYRDDAKKVEGMQVLLQTKRLQSKLNLSKTESPTLKFDL